MSDPTWHTITPKRSSQRGSRTSLEETLRASIELKRFLSAAAAQHASVLVIINDAHRSTRTREALQALASVAPAWGGMSQCRVLVATGSHQASASERHDFESATIAGVPLRLGRFNWHDANHAEDLISIGPYRMNRLVAESGWILPIGSVEPHYFAGVTGPHKTATIGCLSRADIERNHIGALSPDSDILRLAGNPVYDGVVRMVQALREGDRQICALAQVVHADQVTATEVGDCLEVVDRLLPTVRETYVHEIAAPADLLWLRVPPPLGRSLYQADKALKNNHRAVRDGGAIILEAACEDGVGPDAFLKLLRRAPDYASAMHTVATEGYRLGDHKAVKLRHLTDQYGRGVHVALVCGPELSQADAHSAGLTPLPGMDTALEWSRSVVGGPIHRAVRIEDAGFTTVSVAHYDATSTAG